MDIANIKDGLRTTFIGSNILCVEQTTSTMDLARELGMSGASTGTLVIAEKQTAGRGRFGRHWISEPGLNLTFSILLRPDHLNLGQLNMVASMSIIRAIRQTTNLIPTIKWPNDIMINGKKVCGILITNRVSQGSIDFTTIGIGLNTNWDIQSHSLIGRSATSLLMETGEPMNRIALLQELLYQFETAYFELCEHRFPIDQWRDTVSTIGTAVRAQSGSMLYEGVARWIDDDGNLILQQSDGTNISLNAGEVTLQV